MSPTAGITLRYHGAYVIIPCAAAPCAAFAFCPAVGCTLFRLLLEKGACLNNVKFKCWTYGRNAHFPINTQAFFFFINICIKIILWPEKEKTYQLTYSCNGL